MNAELMSSSAFFIEAAAKTVMAFSWPAAKGAPRIEKNARTIATNLLIRVMQCPNKVAILGSSTKLHKALLPLNPFQAPYAWLGCAGVAPRCAMRPRKPASPDDYDGLPAARSRIVQGQSAEKPVHQGWLPIASRR